MPCQLSKTPKKPNVFGGISSAKVLGILLISILNGIWIIRDSGIPNFFFNPSACDRDETLKNE